MEVDMTQVKPKYVSLLLTLLFRMLSITNHVNITEVRTFGTVCDIAVCLPQPPQDTPLYMPLSLTVTAIVKTQLT